MHRTGKRILRVLCLEAIPDWEKILPQAFFALRTVIHDSTGFSPAELVHGKNLRTPVMLLYEKLTEEESVESSVVDYVFELINRMKICQRNWQSYTWKMTNKNRSCAEHDIELESERAIVAKPYRMSPRQIEILKSEVNKMLELKIIEPGESDFTSPLILVEAQGKEARPCINYRRLNKVTRTQFFPLPNIEELLEKVSAAKYISILDLTRGYWQIPLSPRAQSYASRLMANLLRNFEDFAVPYLDDIAIFSLAWDDHLKHLKDVFDSLHSAKLHIKPSKCQFAQAYVKYLGHLVGQGLRTPEELKVQVIKDFPIPTNKTQSMMLGLTKVLFSILLSGMMVIGRAMESGRRGYGSSSGWKVLEFFGLAESLEVAL
ncbi:hypothetical protein TNCV_4312121 [Trichonephila clavipes]|nr:hypothetical protein TNCV_4312121 [Trichonephila clavipes]